MCSLLLGAIVIEIKFIIVPVQRHYSPFNKKFDMSNKLSNCSQVASKLVWYLSIELSVFFGDLEMFGYVLQISILFLNW